MKLDYDILREILTATENENLEALLDDKGDTYLKHLDVLVSGHFIQGVEVIFTSTGVFYKCTFPRLTFEGHQLASNVKDKKLFNVILKHIKDAGYQVSLDMIKEFAPYVIKQAVASFFK